MTGDDKHRQRFLTDNEFSHCQPRSIPDKRLLPVLKIDNVAKFRNAICRYRIINLGPVALSSPGAQAQGREPRALDNSPPKPSKIGAPLAAADDVDLAVTLARDDGRPPSAGDADHRNQPRALREIRRAEHGRSLPQSQLHPGGRGLRTGAAVAAVGCRRSGLRTVIRVHLAGDRRRRPGAGSRTACPSARI